MFYGFILSDVLFLEYDLSTCKCQQKSDTSIFSVKTKPESSIFNNLLDVRMKVCLHQNPNYVQKLYPSIICKVSAYACF